MTLSPIHLPMAGCDGTAAHCKADCHYRRLVETDPRWREYSDRVLAGRGPENVSVVSPSSREPGLLRKVGNFAGAFAQHVAAGFAHVSDTEKARRLAVCEGCPEFLADRRVCAKCGCNVDTKAGWVAAHCPLDKWDTPYPAVKTRHLLYHLAPCAGNGVWRHNVRQLLRRWHLFNGRRIVAVVTGDGNPVPRPASPRFVGMALAPPLESPAAVREALAGTGAEIIEVPNDPDLREVATFLPLFEQAAGDTEPGSVTLYGQCKGVSRSYDTAVMAWVEAIHETYLDYWPHVERVLRRFPVAGSFKKIGAGWPAEDSASQWHYSGSWFWFRNRELFGKPDWRRIERFWSGIEPYPSLHFSAERAGVLFYEGPVGGTNFYNSHFWADTVLPQLYRWRGERYAAGDGRVP